MLDIVLFCLRINWQFLPACEGPRLAWRERRTGLFLSSCVLSIEFYQHARRAWHARNRNFLNFYIYTFVKVILRNHFLINWQLSNKASADQCHMTILRAQV